jgi:hypothetical protein
MNEWRLRQNQFGFINFERFFPWAGFLFAGRSFPV